jgi:hypothetical protein
MVKEDNGLSNNLKRPIYNSFGDKILSCDLFGI